MPLSGYSVVLSIDSSMSFKISQAIDPLFSTKRDATLIYSLASIPRWNLSLSKRTELIIMMCL